MKNYPLGIQTLSEIRSNNYYYIDKTRFVEQLSNGKYFFLSRPRRFGKSLFLDTIKEAFEANRELFKGLYLEKNWDWSQKHPVIKISFGGGVRKSVNDLKIAIRDIIQRNSEMHSLTLNKHDISELFLELINSIKTKYNQKVVLLIDEYDKPILDNIETPEIAKEIREELKGFYSTIKDADPHLKLVFLTGVSKFSKVSIFSGLNNLTDISLESRFADVCGYTQKELEKTFHEELNEYNLEEVKEWYNGYNFRGEKVYNPYDILNLFYSREFRNYWFETGTPTFLIKLIKEKKYYIPELNNLSATDELLNSFDVDTLKIESILFQSGYLTIKQEVRKGNEYFYKLGFPNREVSSSFNGAVLDFLIQKSSVLAENQMVITKAILNQELDNLVSIIHSFYASIPNDWYRSNTIANYEGYYTSVFYAYLTGAGFKTIGEDYTNKGRIDISVVTSKSIFIFEFKVVEEDSSSCTALSQIKQKNYAEKYLNQGKNVFIIGCEFSKTDRNITRYEWEKVV